MGTPLKLAVIGGGGRSQTYSYAIRTNPDRVALTSVCDPSEEALSWWTAEFPGVTTFGSPEELLERADCDAVYIGTPMLLHAAQSIQALKAGKHVLCSVTAAATMDECWELVEAVEQTGLTYMLDENFCYFRSNMMVQNMVDQGVFGTPTYAEGFHVGDARPAMFNADGSLKWRGEMARLYRADQYPTHAIGPIAQWLGINRDGGDRFVSMASWQTSSINTSRFAEANLGSDHPAASPGYFARPDMALTLVRTEKGVVVATKTELGAHRPRQTDYFALQGTGASYLAADPVNAPTRGLSEETPYDAIDPLIWVQGRSDATSQGSPTRWQRLWEYAEEYEHPRWRELDGDARKAGHMGHNVFPLLDFVDAVASGGPPPIDVYDAVTWSCLMPLSVDSWNGGGVPVDMPDFKRGGRGR